MSSLLHCLAVVLLFVALERMTGALWRSAFVSAVFAVHPLHVESVAWIAERKDVLSAFFFTLTLRSYLHYTRAPSIGRYLTVALGVALGLMSKPMLVTLPFVLLLLDYRPLARFETRRSNTGRQTITTRSGKYSADRPFCRFKRRHVSGSTRRNRLDSAVATFRRE